VLAHPQVEVGPGGLGVGADPAETVNDRRALRRLHGRVLGLQQVVGYWQRAPVDHALGGGDRGRVERCGAPGQGIDVIAEVGRGSGQPLDAAASGNQAAAELRLPEHGRLDRGEAHVARQRELVAAAPGPAGDLRDRDHRRP
jgi:hypothetical protein